MFRSAFEHKPRLASSSDPDCWDICSLCHVDGAVSLVLIGHAAAVVGYQIERMNFDDPRPKTNRFSQWSTNI